MDVGAGHLSDYLSGEKQRHQQNPEFRTVVHRFWRYLSNLLVLFPLRPSGTRRTFFIHTSIRYGLFDSGKQVRGLGVVDDGSVGAASPLSIRAGPVPDLLNEPAAEVSEIPAAILAGQIGGLSASALRANPLGLSAGLLHDVFATVTAAT